MVFGTRLRRAKTLLLFSVLVSWSSGVPVAPELTVNLDLPPEERWAAPLKEHVLRAGDGDIDLGWQRTFRPVLDYIETIVPLSDWVKHDKLLTAIASPICGDEMTAEAKGVYKLAADLGYGNTITISELLFFQVFYEILMECTGILAKDGRGHIIHGRNMDMGLTVTNITTKTTWTRGGKPVMISTQYLGYLGVHTGMRVDGWSVQANERVTLVPGPKIGYEKAGLALTAAAFLEGHHPVGRYLREALLQAATYEEALPLLETVPLASPMYAIVGGLTTGTVVTRDRGGLATKMQDTSLYGHFGRAPAGAGVHNMTERYLVQTNWDPWVAKTHAGCTAEMARFGAVEEKLCQDYITALYGVPAGSPCNTLCQLYSDGRREKGNSLMDAMPAAHVNVDNMLAALSTPPVLNGGTRFSGVMSAATNEYQVWIQEKDPPGGAGTRKGVVADPVHADQIRYFLQRLTGIPLGSNSTHASLA